MSSEDSEREYSDPKAEQVAKHVASPRTRKSPHVPPSAGIGSVSVKPPSFWEGCPELWFLQMEAQFDLAGITLDKTKFNTIVSALGESTARVVSDIIKVPPKVNKYETLKSNLISRLSGSETAKLKQLLNEKELGDLSPSQLLREMEALNNSRLSEEVLKSLWLQRLPPQVQAILSCNSGALSELAICADKISEAYKRSEIFSLQKTSVNEVDQNQLSATLELLNTNIVNLSKLLKNFNSVELKDFNSAGRFTSRSTTRSNRNHSRGRTPSRSASESSRVCWYHARFGDRATRCERSCRFYDDKKFSTSSSKATTN